MTDKPEHQFLGETLLTPTPSTRYLPNRTMGESETSRECIGLDAIALTDILDYTADIPTLDRLLVLHYFNLERNPHIANTAWVGMGDDDVQACVNSTVHDMCLYEDSAGTYTPATDGWVSRHERELAILNNSMWLLHYKYNHATDTCFKRAFNLEVLVTAVLDDVIESQM